MPGKGFVRTPVVQSVKNINTAGEPPLRILWPYPDHNLSYKGIADKMEEKYMLKSKCYPQSWLLYRDYTHTTLSFYMQS